MRGIISRAASIALLLYSTQLSEDQFVQAIQIKNLEQISEVMSQVPEKELVSVQSTHKKNHDLEHLMHNKQQELQNRIVNDTNQVHKLEQNLQDAKIELETDQTMLLRHQKVLEEEKEQIALLKKRVGARAQAIDKIELKKQKHIKLEAAADRLVQKEAKVRAKVLQQIKTRIISETEEARKRGIAESKDDPEIIKLAKLDSIKKAEQEQIDDENKEITQLSQDLSNKKNQNQKPNQQLLNKDEKKQPQAAKPQQKEMKKESVKQPEQKKEKAKVEHHKKPKQEEKEKNEAEEKVEKPKEKEPKQSHKIEHKIKKADTKPGAKSAKPAAAPEAGTKVESKVGAGTVAKVEAKTKDVDDDMFKEMKEMNSFGSEEDKALATQLDGEALVKSIGTVLGRDVSKEVKNATPGWVTGKWFKKQGMEGAGDIE